MTKREKTVQLLAKQFALSHGLVWDRLPPKRQAEMRTHATNALATVERQMADFQWMTDDARIQT